MIAANDTLRQPGLDKPFSGYDWIALAVVLATAVVVFTRQFFNDSLGYSDADRLLMDGVFIHDFLHDLPLTGIYDYTVSYFAQYPALSIGYRPPFFPFVEAIFNTVFGINMWSSRLSMLAMGLIGTTAWFLLVRRIFDTPTATIAALILVTLPFVAKWGWYTMGELPLLSLTMLTAFLFFRYAETNWTSFLFAAALSFSLTVWTKQTAFYVAFWFVLYLAIDRTLWMRLKQGKTWIAIGLVLALLTPLVVITVWLGDQNLEQSVGTVASDTTGSAAWEARLHNVLAQPRNLVKYQLTMPALVLALAGMGWAVWRRDRKTVFFFLPIVTTYLFFLYILNPNERYTILWLPAFATFAALPVYYLRTSPWRNHAVAGLALAVLPYQTFAIYDRPPNYATGYRAAAEYVLQHTRSPVTFIDAYNNGYFVYFMRALDDRRGMYVLRGDKLLSSASISQTHRLEVHAHTHEEIRTIFDQYGIEYIVIEDKDYADLPIHKALRAYLAQGPFVLEHSIPVQSTRPALDGVTLMIYRYTDWKTPTAESLTLRLPVVGQTISVPFRKVAQPKPNPGDQQAP